MESFGEFLQRTVQRFAEASERVEQNNSQVASRNSQLREILGEEKYLELIKKELQFLEQKETKAVPLASCDLRLAN